MKSGGGSSVAYADTNVFVALFAGPTHPFHDRALDLFRHVAEGTLTVIVTPIIVAELVYAATSVLGWKRAATAGRLRRMLEADGLLVPELAVLLAALDLFRSRRRLDFPDAYLAAVARTVGPTKIASFDRDFDRIEGVERVSQDRSSMQR